MNRDLEEGCMIWLLEQEVAAQLAELELYHYYAADNQAKAGTAVKSDH